MDKNKERAESLHFVLESHRKLPPSKAEISLTRPSSELRFQVSDPEITGFGVRPSDGAKAWLHGHVHLRVLIVTVALVELRLCVITIQTCHLSFIEDATQHEHLDWDGEEEDEGESQRRLRGHDGPEDGQTDHLDAGEEVHAPRTNLAYVGVVRVILWRHEEQHHSLR